MSRSNHTWHYRGRRLRQLEWGLWPDLDRPGHYFLCYYPEGPDGLRPALGMCPAAVALLAALALVDGRGERTLCRGARTGAFDKKMVSFFSLSNTYRNQLFKRLPFKNGVPIGRN